MTVAKRNVGQTYMIVSVYYALHFDVCSQISRNIVFVVVCSLLPFLTSNFRRILADIFCVTSFPVTMLRLVITVCSSKIHRENCAK